MKLKDFSFFAELPGSYLLMKSQEESFDVLFDVKNGNKINLKPTSNSSRNSSLNSNPFKRTLAEKFENCILEKSSN